MHIAAMKPLALNSSEIPQEDLDKEYKILKELEVELKELGVFKIK